MALTEVSAFKNLSIINDDINSSAAIAGSKISPSFTSDLTVDSGTNTLVSVKCGNAGNAIVRAGGGASNGQGTGAFEVTQNNGLHGGGISYNGDSNPSFVSGESSDHVTFYRLSAGTRTEVFSYAYNSNTVRFNAVPTVAGVSLVKTSDTITDATNAVNVTGTIASAVTATTQSANDNSTKVATTAYVDNAVSSGGGGGGGVTVKNEGTALSTTATTLNFTGQVTASGTGAEKTIDIPNSVRNFSTQGRSNTTFNKSCSITNIGFSIPEAYAISGISNTFAGLISGSNYEKVKGMVDFTPANDDDVDLGSSSLKWDDVYATNGTIQTSDERLKQNIQALTTAEKAVATTLKGLIKTFKYKKAVAAKGDKARIHCGVIAQEVKAAFEAQGLKAEDYALFCYDEWDAVAEEKDEDGNITQPAVAAGNRYSIRYNELLAFIISVL